MREHILEVMLEKNNTKPFFGALFLILLISAGFGYRDIVIKKNFTITTSEKEGMVDASILPEGLGL